MMPLFDRSESLAVIGTAGRDGNPNLTRRLWEDMRDHFSAYLYANNVKHIVSGGAAWADHLAVFAKLNGLVDRLTLFLPAPINYSGYIGPSRSAASASNYYHKRFSQTIISDSLVQINQVLSLPGVNVNFEPEANGYKNMFVRNIKVAAFSTSILAYTFNTFNFPADGGTRHTWDVSNAKTKVHVDLNTFV